MLSGENIRLDVSEDRLHTRSDSSSSQYAATAYASGWAVTAAQPLESAARSQEEGRDPRLTAIYAALTTAANVAQEAYDSSMIRVGVGGSADSSKEKHDYRNPAKQQQDVAELSRDTANAHRALENNFDRQKIQDRLEIQQQATALGTQAMTVYMDSKLDAAKKQVREEMAARGELNGLSETEIDRKVTTSPEFRAADKEYGIGSPFWTASSAMTGLLAGVLGGNVQGGMAAGAAPLLAKLVKDASGENEAARIALHTVVSAALAKAQGGNATAGAIGGFIASAGAESFAAALYGKKADGLTPDEKMVVLNLVAAVSAAGGGVATGNTAGMVSAGNAARVEVENNHLSPSQQKRRSEELVACGDESNCKARVREHYAKEYDKVQEQINTCSTADECVDVARKLKQWRAEIGTRSNELIGKIRNEGADSLTAAEKREWADLRGAQSNFDASITTLIYRAKMLGGSEETTTELTNIFGHAAIANAAGTVSGIAKGNSGGIKGSAIPVPDPVKASNGFNYQSNPKHTPGTKDFGGSRAGIEPKNSFELFDNSISLSGGKKRFSMDRDGNIHQFMSDGAGNYHWAGSTADRRNPLILDNRVKSELRKQEGWKIK